MKRVVIALICFFVLLSIAGCNSGTDAVNPPNGLSITKYSEATGKYFEETPNGYRAVFLNIEEITIERIANWIASCKASDSFYQFIYSDPDSWNMFIYYFPEDGLYGYKSFRFSVTNSTVRVHVVTEDSNSAFLSEYMLIRIQAPRRGVWPNKSELYVDDVMIEVQHSRQT
jgi:hypothetical protein